MTVFAELPTAVLGRLTLTATEEGLSGVYLADHRHAPADRSAWVRDPLRLREAAEQLEEYLAGERQAFALPLAPAGGTPFQRRVWAALEAIPYGTTTTYGALARALGVPRAVRAVGAANGRNPLSIVRPCHRVVGASGALTGYGGGFRPSGRCWCSRPRAFTGEVEPAPEPSHGSATTGTWCARERSAPPGGSPAARWAGARRRGRLRRRVRPRRSAAIGPDAA
jgi:methylated-DNA-[protein]-cysteine S-methyltransferase